MELVIAHLSGAVGILGAVLLFPGYLFRRIRQLATSRAQLDKERIKVYAQFYLKYAPVEHSSWQHLVANHVMLLAVSLYACA